MYLRSNNQTREDESDQNEWKRVNRSVVLRICCRARLVGADALISGYADPGSCSFICSPRLVYLTMWRRVIFAVALVALASSALAADTWDDRTIAARRTRLCAGETGRASWLDRSLYERCDTCSSRCYATTFNATAETNGAPVGLCDQSGEVCSITVLLITAPCCFCKEGHEENDVLQEQLLHDGTEERAELHLTQSRCEVPFMGVLVNGFWTLPLENNCNTSLNAGFEQEWAKDDCTVNQVSDCVIDGPLAGARLFQAYSKNYKNGRYPDPCFADKHWVDSYMSETKGLVSSLFRMWRPNSNALWFDQALTRHTAPREIPCSSIPNVAHIPVYQPPMV